MRNLSSIKPLFAGLLMVLLFATGARADLPADKSRALELMSGYRFSEAYDLYMQLLRQEPDDFEINLMLARAARLSGKLNHARVAYERVLEAAPEEAGLHVEMADLLSLLGDHLAARESLATARRLDPGLEESQLSGVIKQVDRRTSPFSFAGSISGGVIYDSNVNAAPDRRGINLGGIPFDLSSDDVAEEAFGMFMSGGLDLAWRPDLEGDWWLLLDVSGYQRWNFNASPRRDITYGRASTGLRYASPKHMFEVRGKAETILENEDTSLNIYGIELTSIGVVSSNLHNIAKAGLEYRNDYQIRGRDGTYFYISEHLRWFFGQGGHSLIGGIKLYGGDTRERRFRYTGWEPSLTAHFVLPADFSLSTGVAYRYEPYREAATAFESSVGDPNRLDKQWKFSVFLDKKITESLHVFGGWQYVDNKSSSDIYEYDQHQVTMGLSWNF